MNMNTRFTRSWMVIAIAGAAATSSAAEWTQTAGPPGGTLNSTVADGEQTIYGSVSGNILRSDDAGETWTVPAGEGLPPTSFNHPATVIGDAVFARVIVPTQPDDLYVSVDGGETWSPTTITRQASQIQDIHAFNWEGRLLVSVIRFGVEPDLLLVSDDFGQTWDALNPPADGVQTLFFQEDAMLASANGIFRSTDSGETWDLISDTIPLFDVWVLLAATDSAIIVRGGFGGALFRTFNNGQSWSSLIPAGLGNTFAHAVSIDGQTLLTTTPGGLFQSSDDGATWSPIATTGLPTSGLSGLVALGGDALMVDSANGQLISADGGASWSDVSENFIGSDVARIGHANGVLFATLNGGLATYRSADGGASWHEMELFASLFTNATSEAAIDSETILLGTVSRGVFQSTDDGETWTTSNNGLPILHADELGELVYEPINSITQLGDTLFVGTGGASVFVADGSHCACTFTSSGDGVYRSSNGGASWQRVSNGLPINTFIFGEALLHPIHTVQAVGNAVLAATGNNGLFRSTNMGGSWSLVSGLPSAIVDVEVDGDTAYALTGAGLYRSTNAGQSWTLVNGGVTFSDLSILDGTLYGAGQAGTFNTVAVHQSTDGGETWETTGGPANEFVPGLAAGDEALFAATFGQGVWMFTPDGGASEPADLNGDGVVNAADLALLLGSWGACPGCEADLNGDGNVNAADLALLLGAWN